MSETLDVLSPDGHPTGLTKDRDAVHRDGDWHRSFHLWIVKDGRYVLFQRRAETKDIEPQKIDTTVAGHYAAGETLLEVLRETEEEIGLTVTPGDLSYLGTLRSERHYEGITDRELQEVYVMRHEWELFEYGMNYHEVYALYEVPLERALALYRDGSYTAAAGFDAYGRNNHALLISDDTIAQARDSTLAILEKIGTWLETGEVTPFVLEPLAAKGDKGAKGKEKGEKKGKEEKDKKAGKEAKKAKAKEDKAEKPKGKAAKEAKAKKEKTKADKPKEGKTKKKKREDK